MIMISSDEIMLKEEHDYFLDYPYLPHYPVGLMKFNMGATMVQFEIPVHLTPKYPFA
jgi:hypothetical protein